MSGPESQLEREEMVFVLCFSFLPDTRKFLFFSLLGEKGSTGAVLVSAGQNQLES